MYKYGTCQEQFQIWVYHGIWGEDGGSVSSDESDLLKHLDLVNLILAPSYSPAHPDIKIFHH